MPFTPFHLGPVVPIRALWPHWFSLGVFAAVQIAIDLEVLWRLGTAAPTMHGSLHTVPGSLLVGALVLVPSKYGLSLVYATVRTYEARAGRLPGWVLADLNPVSWPSAVVGALVGAVSHVLFDSLIHWDVAPLAPLSRQNPLFLPGGFVWLHVLFALVGGAGLLLWARLAQHRALTPRR